MALELVPNTKKYCSTAWLLSRPHCSSQVDLDFFNMALIQSLYSRYSPLAADLLAGNPLLQTGATTPTAAAMNGSGWCIFVYNLAPDTEENVLWQLFGPFGAVQVVKDSFPFGLHQPSRWQY